MKIENSLINSCGVGQTGHKVDHSVYFYQCVIVLTIEVCILSSI